MSETIIFRNAHEEDVKEIISLAYNQMNKYLEKSYNGEFNWAKWENEIREVIYDQNHGNKLKNASKVNQFTKALIIESSNNKIGFIWFSYYSPEIIWVDSIILNPPYQGMGYGTKIFDHLFTIFKGEFKYLDLGVQDENKRAIKFYENLGFYRIDDIAMAYYLTLRMRKDLANKLSHLI